MLITFSQNWTNINEHTDECGGVRLEFIMNCRWISCIATSPRFHGHQSPRAKPQVWRMAIIQTITLPYNARVHPDSVLKIYDLAIKITKCCVSMLLKYQLSIWAKILHMKWQHSCHFTCKILAQMDNAILMILYITKNLLVKWSTENGFTNKLQVVHGISTYILVCILTKFLIKFYDKLLHMTQPPWNCSRCQTLLWLYKWIVRTIELNQFCIRPLAILVK